jgi:PAS domain S-box-containing protein
VVETIQDGVMIVGSKGTITSVNRAYETVTAHSNTEVLGETLHYIKLQCLLICPQK